MYLQFEHYQQVRSFTELLPHPVCGVWTLERPFTERKTSNAKHCEVNVKIERSNADLAAECRTKTLEREQAETHMWLKQQPKYDSRAMLRTKCY